MDNTIYDRERHAFQEKIALAKLEVSRARLRVDEIKYEEARFEMEMFIVSQKQPQD